MAALFFSILLCLSGFSALFAQALPAAANMAQLDETFKQEVEGHRVNTRSYEQILLGLGGLRQVPGDEEQLRQALRLGKSLRKLNSTILAAQGQQLDLINKINQLSGSSELLPQQSSYVNHYLQKLKELGNEQLTMMEAMKRKSRELQSFIARVPPPKSFVNQLGMKMILLGQGEAAFYISEQCVRQAEFEAMIAFQKDEIRPEQAPEQSPPMSNVNLEQAEQFCRSLSKYEGFTYKVPERRELAMLQQQRRLPELALWCRSKWTPDWREEEAQKRFACFLYTVWDPHRLISGGEEAAVAGELKNASYEQLGFMVISDAKTGRRLRMQRLQAELLD